jgi:hypothetical protein
MSDDSLDAAVLHSRMPHVYVHATCLGSAQADSCMLTEHMACAGCSALLTQCTHQLEGTSSVRPVFTRTM